MDKLSRKLYSLHPGTYTTNPIIQGAYTESIENPHIWNQGLMVEWELMRLRVVTSPPRNFLYPNPQTLDPKL